MTAYKLDINRYYGLMVLFVLITGCKYPKESPVAQTDSTKQSFLEKNVTEWVDPFIGTSNEGNTHPGAVLPWGLVNLNPQTKNFRKKATGPASYEFGDPFIYGFSSVNISGIGCPAAGSIPLKFFTGDFSNDIDRIKSPYSDEKAVPGYYRVSLDKHKATVEMTATQRTGAFRFKTQERTKQVYIDLGANMSHFKGGEIAISEENFIVGYQNDGKFCGTGHQQKIFFAIRPDDDYSTLRIIKNGKFTGNKKAKGNSVGAVLTYDSPQKNNEINIKVGISFVSINNALKNLRQEQKSLSFDEIQKNASREWKSKLSVVSFGKGSEKDFTIFYTALYHSLLAPQVFNDVNGEYITMENGKTLKTDRTRYTTFSLWDTYRTLHPLLTLLYPEQQTDMLNSMIGMYEESGWLPKWELFGQETAVMVGDPASIVIADSYMKGLRNFDTEMAMEAMKKSAEKLVENPIRPGVEQYWKYGFIPMDDRGGNPMEFSFSNGVVWGPVSTTLEYNLADYGIAVMAKEMGDTKTYEKFFMQSMSFKALFDEKSGFLRPKNKNNEWYKPFDPLQRYGDIQLNSSGGMGFTEGTAWHYRFFVPHAIDTLISLKGEARFLKSLNELFSKGYFDMTNEPDIGFPFLFNYIQGNEFRTQEVVRNCIATYFHDGPNGLPGNDDAGTISAWLVFAMMGIYPDAPGIPKYQIALPTFDNIKIKLDNRFYEGDYIHIRKEPEIKTAKKLKINGVAQEDFEIFHDLITSGATIELFHEDKAEQRH
ncbi:MAG: GH92 family glycosyl hydrolase [Saonia sp.]